MKFLASIAILLCLTSATLLGAQDISNDAQPAKAAISASAEAKIVLSAPSIARIGELIRLDVSGSAADSFKWLLVPESVDWLVYEEGAKAVFSARAAGEYRFIVACAKEGTVDVVTHIVRILGPPATPEEGNFAQLLPFWMWDTPLPAAECEALAVSFETIAARASELEEPADWIKATAEANRSILGDNLDAWAPILDKIGAELLRKAQTGALMSPEDHSRVWMEIAAGLRNCC